MTWSRSLGGCKHLTRPVYADAIRTAIGTGERAIELSQSGMLVLMCIAYFQPITRAELSTFSGREVSRDLIGNPRGVGFIASGPRAPQPCGTLHLCDDKRVPA